MYTHDVFIDVKDKEVKFAQIIVTYGDYYDFSVEYLNYEHEGGYWMYDKTHVSKQTAQMCRNVILADLKKKYGIKNLPKIV